RVEAHIEPDAPRGQRATERVQVGRVGDQSAPLEVVEQVRLGGQGRAFFLIELHAGASLSPDPPIGGVASVTRWVWWEGVRREGRLEACRASATQPTRPDGGAQQPGIGGSGLSVASAASWRSPVGG